MEISQERGSGRECQTAMKSHGSGHMGFPRAGPSDAKTEHGVSSLKETQQPASTSGARHKQTYPPLSQIRFT